VAAAPRFVSAQDPSPTPDPTLDPAYDQEEDWNNTGTDFNALASWSAVSGNRVPNSGDVAWFKVAMVTNPNLSASAAIGALYFQSTTSSGYDITRTSNQTFTLLGTATTTTLGTAPSNAAAIAANNTSGTNTIDVPIILGAGGNVTQYFTQATGGTLVVNGVISSPGTNGLNLAGGGTFQFTGANTFTGGLTVQAATLSIATINGASGAGVLGNSANAVVLGGSGTTGTLEYTGATASSTKKFTMATGGTGAFQVDTAGTTLTLSGVIDGSGTLLKSGAGTLSLTGNNTYSGGTTVNAGTLLANNATASTGSGAVTVNGSGTTLGGTGTITGAVTLGNTTPGAILNPGPKGTAATAASVGTLTTGALTLTGANTVHIDAFGTGTSQWDKLVSTAAISLGATSTLDVTIASGLTFTANTTYVLLSGTSLTGTFAGIVDGQIYSFSGYAFTADYTATGFDLVAVPEPGTWIAGALSVLAIGYSQRKRVAILLVRA
jgi:fibronectin-binding autotransporter adhesin